jgi:hypothetical protein
MKKMSWYEQDKQKFSGLRYRCSASQEMLATADYLGGFSEERSAYRSGWPPRAEILALGVGFIAWHVFSAVRDWI